MLQVTKPEGFGNIQLEEVPIPEINEHQVRVETDTTLISRGSELFRRYIREEAVPPSIMGYSLTGTVDTVGAEVTDYQVGERVMVVAPHAQYAVAEPDATDGRIVPLLDGVSFEEGNFSPACHECCRLVGLVRGESRRYCRCLGTRLGRKPDDAGVTRL